jgi:hypothetical protein
MTGNSKFKEIFSNPRVILPVIHVKSEKQALFNAAIARDLDADGIFLINHGIKSHILFDVFNKVKSEFPDLWIGVNCLDLSPAEIFSKVPVDVAGVWVDNAHIHEDHNDQSEAGKVLEIQKANGWSGLYFGGVAFKYQRHVNDLEKAALVASHYMDVITTSGPGTGLPANVEKISRMNAALNDFPLAIASGITPENIHKYLPYAVCFLVATGISKDFHNFDPERLQILIENVRGWKLSNTME